MRTPAELIDALIADTPDWRAETLRALRRIIHEADPGVTETWKWVSARRPGTPVWEHDGSFCHINLLQNRVKLTFHHGASLSDPQGLFNAGLDGNKLRAIDIHPADDLDEKALKRLIRRAVEHNRARAKVRGR